LTGLETDILTQFGVKIRIDELKNLDRVELEETIKEQLVKKYAEKEALIGPELLRETERMIMLNVIDNQWKDHLLSMDHLKEGINLRSYGQKDPLIEYKKEGFELFQDMMDRIEDETIRYLFFLQRVEDPGASVPYPEVWAEEPEDGGEPVGVAASPSVNSLANEDRQSAAQKAAQNSVLDFTRKIERKKEKELAAIQFIGGEASKPKQPVLAAKKVGPNDPCPCGSGKKYKKCCKP
jgi:preprotein translocase subunit SecA